MKYRFVLIAGALFALACQALFGNLSVPNGRYCNVGDDTCGAGQVCDPMLHACVDATGNSDGGSDGGTNPALGHDFFAAPVVQIPLQSGPNVILKGVLYKANFDNVPPSDLFIMGINSYTIVTLTGPSTTFKTVNYKGSGSPEMAAIGRLDDDEIDDVVLVFPQDQRAEIITSKGGGPVAPTLTARPRGVAIGDFDADEKNDIAIGDEAGKVSIYHGLGGGALDATPSVVMPPVAGLRLDAMVTVRGVVLDASDSLALALFDLSASQMHRVQLILGSTARSFRVDHSDTLDGIPTDLVAGNFSGGSRDLVVLVGGDKLDVFSDLRASDLTAKSTINLMPYRTSTTVPLRGRLAVGRYYPQTLPAKTLDDLAVLLDDGWVALARGPGSGPLRSFEVASNRALAVDRIVSGDFSPDSSGRDDLAAYSEPGNVGLLTLVRNNVGGNLGNLVMAQRHPLGMGLPATTPLVYTGRFTDTQKDDVVVVGQGPASSISRCVLDANRALTCPEARSLPAAVSAAATVTCPDQKARMLLSLGSRALNLLDFTGTAATETQVIATAATLKQIEVADLDQDGANDIVMLDSNNGINVMYGTPGNGGCAFNAASPSTVTPSGLPGPGATVMIAVGDGNGDNYPDLLIGYDNTVNLYLNSKDRRFNAGTLSNNNISPLVGLAIADLRALRKPDVAVLSLVNAGTSSSLTLLSPDVGTGSLVPVGNPMTVPLPYRRLLVSDLGSDGLRELVMLNKVRGMVSTASYAAQGSATLKHYAIGKNPEWFAVGQVDPDPTSARDIVVIDSTVVGSNTTSLWILQGLLPGQLVP